MLHPTRLDPEDTARHALARQPPGALPQRPARAARWPRRVQRLGWRWLRRLGAALARAEQRITDNFRVPPHGG
ncbi:MULTISPECIES: hypothetical protein [unclassified Acidovorax]|uniref:hypothetical protein n=1 Tax=unclassified Acidovorax TaxID=2684926 RepID=UPI00070006C2|nr:MULTISPECIES: hypothetical protein [unclassified Acidovorax]KRB35951.1 hypothetical protein ASD94_20485 [Acidovorax sp. Root70]PUA95874.1 hypothetical protein C8C99_0677 [Acidovorax sp. 107]